MAITDADLLPEVDVEQLIGECYTPFPQNVIKIRQDAGTGNKPCPMWDTPNIPGASMRSFHSPGTFGPKWPE